MSMSQAELDSEVLECARYGEDDDLRAMLMAGGGVNFRDPAGNTAMHKASANGEVGCLRILKEFGADYCANAEGNLPSHWAAQNAKVEALQFLIDTYGEQVDMLAQNRFGRSTLTEAFQSQNESILEMCLAHPSATEERLMPKGGPATLEEGMQDMEIADGDSASASSAAAVSHTMALGVGAQTLCMRELPITRADNPFGSETAPEDDTTGLGLWPASVLAARWVATDLRAEMANKVVVELGCGCGLPGLSAARYCDPSPSAVYLTDIHEPTLLNAAHNAFTNSPTFTSASSTPSLPPTTVFASASFSCGVASVTGASVPVTVQRVSWTDPNSFPPPADVLLGSDLVYDTAILGALKQAVAGMLAPGGTFYYIAPEEGRDGMEGLVNALADVGLQCVDSQPCPEALFASPLVDVAGDEAAVSASDAFVLHFYDLAARKPHRCFTFRRA